MMRWVVTGPAGAGKSMLCKALVARGASLVDGDALGHEILARPGTVQAVAERFGADCVSGGLVDRGRLGSLVFADPVALADLDALTHGPLSDLMEETLAGLAATGVAPLAVLDAAVYFRLPSPPAADLVILVDAPAEVRTERLRHRAGLTVQQATARVAAQAGMFAGWRRADVTVTNDGSPEDLERAAGRLWLRYGPDRRPDQED